VQAPERCYLHRTITSGQRRKMKHTLPSCPRAMATMQRPKFCSLWPSPTYFIYTLAAARAASQTTATASCYCTNSSILEYILQSKLRWSTHQSRPRLFLACWSCFSSGSTRTAPSFSARSLPDSVVRLSPPFLRPAPQQQQTRTCPRACSQKHTWYARAARRTEEE